MMKKKIDRYTCVITLFVMILIGWFIWLRVWWVRVNNMEQGRYMNQCYECVDDSCTVWSTTRYDKEGFKYESIRYCEKSQLNNVLLKEQKSAYKEFKNK